MLLLNINNIQRYRKIYSKIRTLSEGINHHEIIINLHEKR